MPDMQDTHETLVITVPKGTVVQREPYRPPPRPPLTPPPTTLNASIDALIAKGTDKNVFTSYTASMGKLDLSATWNEACYGRALNLGPIAWHDDWTWFNPAVNAMVGPTLGRSIAVSPHICIAHAQHGGEAPGFTLQYKSKTGQIHNRKIVKDFVTANSNPVNLWRVCWLDQPLPMDCVGYLPTKDSDFKGKYVCFLNQFHELRIGMVNNQTSNYSSVVIHGGYDAKYSSYYRTPIGGDSGKPIFGVIGNEIVLLSYWWYPSGGSSTHFDIDSIMETAGYLEETMTGVRGGQFKPRQIRCV